MLLITLPIRMMSKKVERYIKKVVYLPISELVNKINATHQKEKLDLHALTHLHQRAEKLHHVFIAITSILPLLGILGTIIALLNSASADIVLLKTNFTFALTSTFWGLVGAIICKSLEGLISPALDHNGQSIQLLLTRMDIDTQ